MYNEKDKEDIRKKLKELVEKSNQIKAITKTRFINELEEVKKKNKNLHLRNILNYVFSDLEGRGVEDLREQLKERVKIAMGFIDKSEGEVIKNILKKVKRGSTVMAGENNPLIKYLKKKKEIHIANKKKNEHVDLALIPVHKIDSKAHIFTNKKNISIIEKANKMEIPVYGYIHSFKFVPTITNKKKIKPHLVKSIISDFGIFEPEIFIAELKLNRPWLFF